MSNTVKDFVYDILQLPEWNEFDARTKEVKALRDAIFDHWKKNAESWVLPNKLKIGDTTLELESIDSGMSDETTATYKSTFFRPSEFTIQFNSKDRFYQLLETAGAKVVE